MLSRLRRKRLILSSFILCLLTILSFYLLSNKYFPRDSSEKRSENLKVSVQALKENNADNAVPQDSEETTLRTPSEIAEMARGSLVVLETEDRDGKRLGFGSGFFIKTNQIATCLHVIEGTAKGSVKLVGTELESSSASRLSLR